MNVQTAHRPFSAASSALALALAALAHTLAWPVAAAEPAEVSVTRSRVVLEDVMPGCPPSACKTDLGPAPPPLSSWLLDASVIRSALESVGEDRRTLRDVQSVRVVSAGRVLGPAEAAEFARPSIESALPAGVTLVEVAAEAAGAGHHDRHGRRPARRTLEPSRSDPGPAHDLGERRARRRAARPEPRARHRAW
jgi:hypothetical protein